MFKITPVCTANFSIFCVPRYSIQCTPVHKNCVPKKVVSAIRYLDDFSKKFHYPTAYFKGLFHEKVGKIGRFIE